MTFYKKYYPVLNCLYFRLSLECKNKIKLYFINSSPQEYTLVGGNVAYCEGKLNSEFVSFSTVSDLWIKTK